MSIDKTMRLYYTLPVPADLRRFGLASWPPARNNTHSASPQGADCEVAMIRQALFLGAAALLLAGCTVSDGPTTRPSHDRALNDPMNWSPSIERDSITGGPTNHLDKKGMKRDWDSFWNP
jgi:hypothetical protein